MRRTLKPGAPGVGGRSASPQHVTQVFTSAVPCAYAQNETHAVWEPLARLALDAAYEGTLLVGAALALHRGHRVAVYLTCVGGGAFGNEERWILDAIERAVDSVKSLPLDVFLVHYGHVPASARYRRMEREVSRPLRTGGDKAELRVAPATCATLSDHATRIFQQF